MSRASQRRRTGRRRPTTISTERRNEYPADSARPTHRSPRRSEWSIILHGIARSLVRHWMLLRALRVVWGVPMAKQIKQEWREGTKALCARGRRGRRGWRGCWSRTRPAHQDGPSDGRRPNSRERFRHHAAPWNSPPLPRARHTLSTTKGDCRPHRIARLGSKGLRWMHRRLAGPIAGPIAGPSPLVRWTLSARRVRLARASPVGLVHHYAGRAQFNDRVDAINHPASAHCQASFGTHGSIYDHRGRDNNKGRRSPSKTNPKGAQGRAKRRGGNPRGVESGSGQRVARAKG